MSDPKHLAKIVAKAIFYASIQASIGSVEMSSKFSVINFSKDQVTLQRAADALKNYVLIGMVWTIGTMLALYGSYGNVGAAVGLLANLVMMLWIILSYLHAFKEAAKDYNLEYPTLVTGKDLLYVAALIGVSYIGFQCISRSMTSGQLETSPIYDF